MTVNRLCRFAVALMGGGLLAVPAVAAEVTVPQRILDAGKVVFCTELAFPPWDMLDVETQQPAGFDIDIGAAVAEEFGVTSEHRNITFDGLIPALQAGQCDAIISGLYDQPSRREVVDFAHYAVTGTSAILDADSTLEVATIGDLGGHKVAVGIGTAGETLLAEVNQTLRDEGKPEMQIVVLQSSAEAFQQLAAGLVEAYVGSTDQAGYYNMLQPGSVKLGGEPLNQLNTGIATLKGDTELHEAFQTALANMRAGGTYTEVLEKWSFQALSID